MRSGTDNRFLQLWRYVPGTNSPYGPDYFLTTFREHDYDFSDCAPIHNIWSLAEIGNRMADNGFGFSGGSLAAKSIGLITTLLEDPIGSYHWPRFRVAAGGPQKRENVTDLTHFSTCSPAPITNVKKISDIAIQCNTRHGICVDARAATAVINNGTVFSDGSFTLSDEPDIPFVCDPVYWQEKFSVQWEQSADEGKTWRYLPDTAIDLNGNKLVIGQADWDGGPKIDSQFYGIIDSVRISRGVARYTGDVCVPYSPLDKESNLIDEHVIFALNLKDDDDTRIPGSHTIKYFVKNRGWLNPGVVGADPDATFLESDFTVKVATFDRNIVLSGSTPPVGIVGSPNPDVYVDNVTVYDGDIVFVLTDIPAKNGLWRVNGQVDAWTKYTDSDIPTVVNPDVVYFFRIADGANHKDKMFALESVSPQTWIQIAEIPSLRKFHPEEIPEDPANPPDRTPGNTADNVAYNFIDNRQLLTYSNQSSGYKGLRCGIQFPVHYDLVAESDIVKQALYISDIQLPPPPNLNLTRTISVNLATSEYLKAGTYGEQDVDGETATAGVTVLVKDQNNPKENGIYRARKGTGNARQEWQRIRKDDNTFDNFNGAYVKVYDGNRNLGTCWYGTSGDVTPNEYPIRFARDEILAVYKDDFCVESYFKVAGFLHPAVKTMPAASSLSAPPEKWEDRTGKKMTLLETYHRASGREGATPSTGIRIHFKPADGEHNGRVYVDIWTYAEKVSQSTTTGTTTGAENWTGPALCSGVISAGEFHHVAVTRSKSVFYLYVDGVLHDSLIAQTKLFAPKNRTATQNHIRYRAKAFFGAIQEDTTPYARFDVQPPEFYYDRDDSNAGTLDFNGAAGSLTKTSIPGKILNLPENWPQNDVTLHLPATSPGKPIPAYTAPAHVYVVYTPAGNTTSFKVKYTPNLRFPTPTIHVDLATAAKDAEDEDERPIPNRGAIGLAGLTSLINLDPDSDQSVTLNVSAGIPLSNLNFISGDSQTTILLLGTPASFSVASHGLSVGSTVAFRLVGETTDSVSERPLTVTNGTVSVFNLVGHGFAVGTRIIFKHDNSGVVPLGLSLDTGYYIVSENYGVNSFSISLTPDGTPISTRIPTGSNPTQLYVSVALNGLVFGKKYFVVADGLGLNTFRVSDTFGGAPIACSGAVTGTLYTIKTPATIQLASSHGLSAGLKIQFKAASSGVGFPYGLLPNRDYYVSASGLTSTSFKISEAVGNTDQLYTVGTLSGTVFIATSAVLANRSNHGLSENGRFIFKQNDIRAIDDVATVVEVNELANPRTIKTQVTVVGSTPPPPRVYTFPSCYSISTGLEVGDVLRAGDIIATPTSGCGTAVALPPGLIAGTYYYAVSVTTNTFRIAATSGGPPIYTYNSDGSTVSVSIEKPANLLEIPLTIDGVPVKEGTRILVKDQSPATDVADTPGREDGHPDNGIYIAQNGPWVRAPEMAQNSQIKQFQRVLVYGGATNSSEAFTMRIGSDVKQRNYQIGVTPLAFPKATDDPATSVDFECRLEVSTCAGGDPRRPVVVNTTAERDAIENNNRFPGLFVRVNFPTGSSNPKNYVIPATAVSPYNNTTDWLEQPDEPLTDAVETVLDKPVLSVYAVTTANVSRFGVNVNSAVVDNAPQPTDGWAGTYIFVRAQTNPAENGVYVVSSGNWLRAPELSEASQFVDGFYISPTNGNLFRTYSTNAFKLSIPPDFVLGETPITCYTNTDRSDAPQYGNGLFRLSKLHLPVQWSSTNEPPIEQDTNLPKIGGGTPVEFNDPIDVGAIIKAIDDKKVFRIRTRCLYSADESDVYGRYIIYRNAEKLGITNIA